MPPAPGASAGAVPPLRGALDVPEPRPLGAGAPTVELPVYAPGEAIDAPALPAATGPRRGLRPRRRSRLQRVLIGLSGGTLLVVVGGVLAVATVLSPIGARRAARAAADRDLSGELVPGERIVARAYVAQRNWWDNFRESFGVLAATDRRLLHVGVPPVPWLARGVPGPPELRVQSFPYDAPFEAEARRLFLGLTRGVVVRTPSGDVAFLVSRGEAARAREIESVVQRAMAVRTEALQREQAGRIAPPPPATVYGYHVVRYGEALSSIARRYRTSVDVIRQLNRLPATGIRAGQRLRVPIPPGSDSAAVAAPAPTRAPQPSAF